MAFTRPTLQQIIDRISGDFVSKISGATTLAMRSVLQIMARAYGAAVHLLYGYLQHMFKQLFATTATDSYLDIIGAELGINRKTAEKATGTITITGTPTITIPANTALRSSSNIRYLTNDSAAIEAEGTVEVAITCDTEGIDGNDSPGITLTFDSPIAGVNSTAIVGSAGLSNGTAKEGHEEYRARILARKRFAPSGGTATDLENWAKEVSFVTRAWCVERYNGPGTAALFFVCDNQSPITPTTDQITEVRSYLEAHIDANGIVVGIPVTMSPGLLVSAPVLRTLDFVIQISPNTQIVKNAAEAQLNDLLEREAYPGNRVYLSSINEAISAAIGEDHHNVYYPNDSPTMAYNEVGVLGSITWG